MEALSNAIGTFFIIRAQPYEVRHIQRFDFIFHQPSVLKYKK